MTAASNIPWSVKGIDPKTRETAKDLARRSGMTLGEYLNSLIASGEGGLEPRPSDAAKGPAPGELAGALERLSERIEAAEQRSSAAISGVDRSVQGVIARLTATEQGQAAVALRVETMERDVSAGRLILAEAEGTGPAPMEAFKSLESAIGKVATQLYESDERNGTALSKIVERLERAEAQTTSAVRRLETSFAGLDERLRVTEQRSPATGAGVGEARFEQLASELSDRMDAARAEMAETLERASVGRVDQIERVVEGLTTHVEAAERRSHQAIEKLGHEVLRVAGTLGKRMVQVETRAADAVEQVGGEVVRIATAMETRLRVSDNAHAEALERLGDEIGRISERLAERIAAAERRSAQAIDDVGEQVLRATDKLNSRYDRAAGDLADRIRASDERTARFLEEARDRIDARLGDSPRRLGAAPAFRTFEDAPTAAFARHEPPVDPASPFVSAGGPTRARLERTPAAAFPPLESVVVVALAPPEPEPEPKPAQQPPAEMAAPVETPVEPEAPPAAAKVEPAPEPAVASEPVALELDVPVPLAAPEPEAASAEVAVEVEVAEEIDEALELNVEAEALVEEPSTGFEPDDEFTAPAPALVSAPALAELDSTDDWPSAEFVPASSAIADEIAELGPEPELSQAALEIHEPEPAAPAPEETFEPLDEFDDLVAFQHQPRPEPALAEVGEPVLPVMVDPSPPLSTRDVLERARAAARAGAKAGPAPGRAAPAAAPSAKSGLLGGLRLPSLGKPSLRRGGTLRTALIASATAAALSVFFASWAIFAEQDREGADTRAQVAERGAAPEAATPPSTPPLRQVSSLRLEPAEAPGVDPAALYAAGVKQLEAGGAGAVAEIRRAAELGHAPAQLHLASLHETGARGVAKDAVEARRWTIRAAEGGDKRAMHNLGLMFFEGVGGPKDLVSAGRWFRRAADLGLSDSQYNLGLIHDRGHGVARNPAEAYKWFLIAARSGDAEARSAAERLERGLSGDAKTAAERAALSFRPNGLRPASAVAATADAQVAAAQRALSRLGYYKGPADGRASPALRAAVTAWQRAEGAQPDGVIDADVVSKLAVSG